jgi:hypothetical protein
VGPGTVLVDVEYNLLVRPRHLNHKYELNDIQSAQWLCGAFQVDANDVAPSLGAGKHAKGLVQVGRQSSPTALPLINPISRSVPTLPQISL